MTQPSALQDRWKALAPREQNLVLAAGTVVALALLWWVAVAPALGTLRAAPARHAALDAQLQRMPCIQWSWGLGVTGYISAAPRSAHPGGVDAA